METASADQVDLTYAVPAASHGHRVLAGVSILIGGLGLIVLGGCFLIGVMLISTNGFNTVAPAPLGTQSIILLYVLYLLAAIAFVAAALVIIAGLRALFRVMRS